MSFHVYIDDTASWSARSLEWARALAAPYVGLGRSVRIEWREESAPIRCWAYDYDRYEWVEQPLYTHSMASSRHPLL